MKPRRLKLVSGEHDFCLDCGAPLIPCICHEGCPGGMCSRPACEWHLRPEQVAELAAKKVQTPPF